MDLQVVSGFEPCEGFSERWWDHRGRHYFDNALFLTVRIGTEEIARIELDEKVDPPYYVDVPPLGDSPLEIQLIEVRADLRCKGIGGTIVAALASDFPGRRLLAEAWVRKHAQTILDGDPTRVAGALRRAATTAGLDKSARENADKCATYLTNKKTFLDYPTALKQGWPIATGIIEGACRHLVKDRMDLTGARWGLHGAEAILKLRALHSNGDFEPYWAWHLAQERRRVHQSRYLDGAMPRAA